MGVLRYRRHCRLFAKRSKFSASPSLDCMFRVWFAPKTKHRLRPEKADLPRRVLVKIQIQNLIVVDSYKLSGICENKAKFCIRTRWARVKAFSTPILSRANFSSACPEALGRAVGSSVFITGIILYFRSVSAFKSPSLKKDAIKLS